MAIDGQAFFDRKVRQFRMGASHAVFKPDYISAVNSTLAEIGIATNAASDILPITGTEASIGLDDDLEWALMFGVDYWLVRIGHKSGDLNIASAFAAWDGAKASLRVHRDQAATEAATNGEVIGMLDD